MNDASADEIFKETDRFTTIESLQDGWYAENGIPGTGSGQKVPENVLANSRRIRDLIVAAGIRCCVFPTIEGGVSIEESEENEDDCFAVTLNRNGSATVVSFDDEEAEEDHEDASLLPGCSRWLSARLSRAV